MISLNGYFTSIQENYYVKYFLAIYFEKERVNYITLHK